MRDARFGGVRGHRVVEISINSGGGGGGGGGFGTKCLYYNIISRTHIDWVYFVQARIKIFEAPI